MKENKNEKMSDDIETKSGEGVSALTTTVHNIPGLDYESKRIYHGKECGDKHCFRCELFEKGYDFITVKELEDMFSDKEKNKVLRVLNVNDEEVTDEKAEKTVIFLGDSITISGDLDVVCEARAAT